MDLTLQKNLYGLWTFISILLGSTPFPFKVCLDANSKKKKKEFVWMLSYSSYSTCIGVDWGEIWTNFHLNPLQHTLVEVDTSTSKQGLILLSLRSIWYIFLPLDRSPKMMQGPKEDDSRRHDWIRQLDENRTHRSSWLSESRQEKIYKTVWNVLVWAG